MYSSLRRAVCRMCGKEADLSAPLKNGGALRICYGCARALGEVWVKQHGT